MATAAMRTSHARTVFRKIDVHHPESSKTTNAILSCRVPSQLLELWDKEKELFGWKTAIDVMNRMAKLKIKVDPAKEPRLAELLNFIVIALKQYNMSSTGRLGHPTLDLSSLRESLEKLDLNGTHAYATLKLKIQKEYDDPFEEDESEVKEQG